MDLTSTKYLVKLAAFARAHGFRITCSTGGGHNPGSLHPRGRALDLSVRGKTAAEVDAFKERAHECGFTVRDERVHPPGQAVWSGPHLHMEDRDGLA